MNATTSPPATPRPELEAPPPRPFSFARLRDAVYDFFRGLGAVFAWLNRWLVRSAGAYGVLLHMPAWPTDAQPTLKKILQPIFGWLIHVGLVRNLVLVVIYTAVFFVGEYAPPWLALIALGYGLWGVLAIGRAWAENETQRRRIAKKMDDTRADDLPELQWTVLISALMLLWLLPLFFHRLQDAFGLFQVDEETPWWRWVLFIVDKNYLTALPEFLDMMPHVTSIRVKAPVGKFLLLASRLLFLYYVIHTIIRLIGIWTSINDAILAVKTDPDMAVRLGRRALQPLLRRLDETKDAEERQKIILALGQLGDLEVWPQVVAIIHDKTQPIEVRGQAVLALGDLGGQESCKLLRNILNEKWYREEANPDHAHVLPMRAAEALEKLKDIDPVPILLTHLRRFRRPQSVDDLEPLPDIRDRVVRALGRRLSDPAAPDRSTRVAEVGALIRDGAPAASETTELLAATQNKGRENPWASLLDDPRFRVKRKTARALAQLGDEAGIKPLTDLLWRHTNPQLIQATALALGDLIATCRQRAGWADGHKDLINRAIEALIMLLRRYGSDETLRAAEYALEKVDLPRACSRLREVWANCLNQPVINSMELINSTTALRKLLGEDRDTRNALFNDLFTRFQAVADTEANRPIRMTLHDALAHLDERRLRELQTGQAPVALLLLEAQVAEV